MVWTAELEFHLQEAAFSDDADLRSQHRGVVRFLRELLSGSLMANYEQKARVRLGLDNTPGLPENGNPYMDSDGLGPTDEVRA